MSSIRIRPAAAALCVALGALSACTRTASDQTAWARAALERNTNIEIVATDPQTHTFTVRNKATGELHMVRADDLIAGVAPAAAAADTPAAASAAGGSAAMSAAATDAAAPPAAAPAWRSDAGVAPAPASASRAEADTAPALPASSGASAAVVGRVLEAGPGYSITSAAPPPAAGAHGASSAVTASAVERRHDPIVCQGARLLQIDNRNLVFDGDAVSAEDGCEIHITNSRISASGVGVSARAASVYVDNSQIEGVAASIDASQGAQIYAESSHFYGLSRRLDTATFHDLGGNVWN